MLAYFVLMHPGGYQIDSNLSDRLDRFLLTGHLYRPTRDPRAPFPRSPPSSRASLEFSRAMYLRARMTTLARMMRMLGGGATLLVLGLAPDPFQPINKNLWTNTYTLAGGRLGDHRLRPRLLDLRRAQTRQTLVATVRLVRNECDRGVHFHGLLEDLAAMSGLRVSVFDAFAKFLNTPNAALPYSLVHVAASLTFAWFGYRRRWFLKF